MLTQKIFEKQGCSLLFWQCSGNATYGQLYLPKAANHINDRLFKITNDVLTHINGRQAMVDRYCMPKAHKNIRTSRKR
jgi:hypothetical protein